MRDLIEFCNDDDRPLQLLIDVLHGPLRPTDAGLAMLLQQSHLDPAGDWHAFSEETAPGGTRTSEGAPRRAGFIARERLGACIGHTAGLARADFS